MNEKIFDIPQERIDAIAYAADLETLRINRWSLFDLYKDKEGSLSTGTEDLDSDIMQTGFIYIITNITGLETGTKPTTVSLGYTRGGVYHILTKQTPANNNDSVDYVGQLVLREGDAIRARFKGATTGNTIELFVNGYKIRPQKY